MGFILITKELLLKKFNISEDQIINSGLSLEELNYIASDFKGHKYDEYEKIMKGFISKYLEKYRSCQDSFISCESERSDPSCSKGYT